MSPESPYTAVVLHPDGEARDGLVRGLEETGFRVTLADDYDDFVRFAGAGEHDLVVLSITAIPAGEEGLSSIPRGPADPHLMVVSPPERSDEGMEYIEQGARTAIPWPCSTRLLHNALVAAISRIEQDRRGSRMEEMAELWDISKALTSGRGTRDLLEMILDSALRVTGADTGSVMLVEKGREEMSIASARGIPSEVVRSTKVRVGEGIAGWVAQHGEPLLLRDGHEDFQRFKDHTQRSHIRSSLCMPIKSTGGEIMGTLSLNQEKGDRAFTRRDLYLMTIYAAEAGTVIQGARSVEELQFTHERLRHSHERLMTIQAQLVQSAKMAAVGMLASGIAHEFNNLLTGILGMAQLAQHTSKPEHVEKALRVAISNCEKARTVVRNLLRFSSQFKKVREQTDICDLVEETLGLVAREMEKAGIQVVRHFEERPVISVNRGEIQQVLLNLLINARQAMEPDGGTLELAVRVVGPHVHVVVSDSGCGIPEENLARIFEPFFSTKSLLGGGDAPEGSGLGLSVSYGIIKGHGGRILVRSEPGGGTVFTLELPVRAPRREGYTDRKKKDSTRLKKNADRAPARPAPLRVLVVDDEWWVREFLKEALLEGGCEVFTAEEGDAAMRLVQEKKPHMVFQDLVMPGVRGETLARRILEAAPATQLVLMTGRLEPLDAIEKNLDRGVFAYLRKPFEVQDVFNILNLDGPKEERRAGEGD